MQAWPHKAAVLPGLSFQRGNKRPMCEGPGVVRASRFMRSSCASLRGNSGNLQLGPPAT